MTAPIEMVKNCMRCGNNFTGTKYKYCCSAQCVIKHNIAIRDEDVREKAQETEDGRKDSQ